MNTTNMRGTPRPKLSLRYGAVHAQQALTGRGPRAPRINAMIPTPELRRLVAKMVD